MKSKRNGPDRRYFKKMRLLSLVMALSLLISLFPFSYIFAWSAPASVTINKSQEVSFFSFGNGNPMKTGFYYIAGSNEIAYCAEADAYGPGGTGYSLNDTGLGSASYLNGIKAVIQHGYPFNLNSLSADDARYATQIAIHWLESYFLGGSSGYDYTIRNSTTANGHNEALLFALTLFDLGVSQQPIQPIVTLETPTSWASTGGVLQCNVQVYQANTDYWQVTSLPAGLISVGGLSFTGDANLTLQMTNGTAYASSNKTITIQGYTNRDTSNIHVFTAGGSYQSMVAIHIQSNGLDPTSVTLRDALGRISINKQTNFGSGNSAPEQDAVFQIYSLNPEGLAAIITTDANGIASSGDLPYGSYNIHQAIAPEGTKAAADIAVTIDSVSPNIFLEVYNDSYLGRVEINKTVASAAGAIAEPGAVFRIYPHGESYDSAGGDVRDEFVTDAAGNGVSNWLRYGVYDMVQTTAPAGVQLNSGTWSFILGADGSSFIDNDIDLINISDQPNHGNLDILKTKSDGSDNLEAGAVFQVFLRDSGSYADAPSEAKATITTGADGHAAALNLEYGIYEVQQTAAGEGTKTAPAFSVTIGAVNEETTYSSVTNDVYWGQAEIYKTTVFGANAKVEPGATFRIWNGVFASYDAAPFTERDEITTDAKGYAISKLLPYGSYTAVQTGYPTGTQINPGSWIFNLGIDGDVYVDNDTDMQNITNLPTFGSLELSKTTNRGYSVPESGAVFEVYCTDFASYSAAPAGYRDTITTNIAGDAATIELPYGVYNIHQTGMPAGTKPIADFLVTLGAVNGEKVHRDIVNQSYWGDIMIVKYKSAPSEYTEKSVIEPGATFCIYPSEFPSYPEAVAALTSVQVLYLTDEITSGMAGIAVTNHPLPFGTYTVEQIDTSANLYTFKVDAWQVNIGAADNLTYTYIRNNTIYEQYLRIIKTDAGTGKVIRLAGAAFQILAEDGITVLADKNGNTEFFTDNSGLINIRDLPLTVGSYCIRETMAPMGYILNTELKKFAVSITDHGSSVVTIDYGVDIRDVTFEDAAQTCLLTVEKHGDVLTSAARIAAVKADTGTQYSDGEGQDLFVYSFGYSLTGKAGAQFEIRVGETDITDQDGFVKLYDKDADGIRETPLKAGMSIGYITTASITQKDGSVKYIASLSGLPLDAISGTARYVAREVKAPDGDLINPELLIFDFTFADQNISQIQKDQSVNDARQKVNITVEKQKEAAVWNDVSKTFDWTLAGAPEILFGLYTANSMLAPDGSILVPAGSLVDVLYTDVTGFGKTTQDLPMGSYYAKELNATPDVFYDEGAIYPVIASPTEDQNITVAIFALNDGDTIINNEIAGIMKVFKKASDTNLPMAGVVFDVYDNLGNTVDTITTGSDGMARTILLPYGTYYLIETRTSTGYALSGRIDFSIYMPPAADMSISEAEITILNYRIPATATPLPALTPTPASSGILSEYREAASKTGEQGGSKIAAGAMLLLLFLITQHILKRRRHLDEEK